MKAQKAIKRVIKALKYVLYSLLFIVIALLIIGFAKPLWHYIVTYPALEKEIAEFKLLRKETPKTTKQNVYRGVMHVHSYLSHDSEGNLNDLIPAAKNNGIDFIFLTDHPRYQLDSFPRGYHGNYDGVLIESGSEKHGYVCWPLDTMIIDLKTNPDTIAKNVVQQGGIVFFSHTEEPRNWANTWYQGMEMYNFHTDTKDESLLPNVLNFLVNGKKYRIWAMRQMFDEQTAILARWDSLNTYRHHVGFSAVDTHENQNIRARYTADGKVEWVGPNADVIDTTDVTIFNRWLFHEPDVNDWIFKLMIDTYNEGFNYITNYVFADTLSTPSLAKNIKAGHLYSAFKSLGDAKGFNFLAENNSGEVEAIMGDSISVDEFKSFNAVTPLPGHFRLIYNGDEIDNSDVDSYHYSWNGPVKKGAYRLEVHILLRGKYVPWIYSNPIYIY